MGRLVTDQIKNITIKYNHFNKVSEIYDATTEMLKVEYAYNERGQKIRKTVFTTAAGSEDYEYVMITHYLNDLSGNVMAVYTDTRLYTDPPNVHLTELTLYGTGRLGLLNNMTENISPYVYELTDHIGNVRATVLSVKVTGAVEVMSYTDYYPHGSVMPGRHYESSNGYRYDFQGIEKDAELNWNNFELRMYDANLGRWMSPDPYREFHSPYLAMGNDPINRIDPDGGRSMDIASTEPVVNEDYGRNQVDPFDMVGAGDGGGDGLGGLSATHSNYSDYNSDDIHFINPFTNERVGSNNINSQNSYASMLLYYENNKDKIVYTSSYESNGINAINKASLTMGTMTLDWRYIEKSDFDWAQGGGGFMDGFINSPASDMGSGSSFASYIGLHIDKTNSLLKYTADNSSGWSNKAIALKAAKNVAIIGKSFGIAGAVFTGVESAFDGNGFTMGDGVKVGIGLLTTFTPIGWAYGIADLGFGIFTGTTITDRIGHGIDTALK